jgi:carbamate kinase
LSQTACAHLLSLLPGNALSSPGEPLDTANQERTAGDAGRVVARVAQTDRLVVMHGTCPRVAPLGLIGHVVGSNATYRRFNRTARFLEPTALDEVKGGRERV